MSKVTSFNKANLKDIRAEFQAAVDKVANKLGVKAELGNITFTNDSFRVRLEVETKTVGTSVKGKFETDAILAGINPKSYGKVFTSGRRKFKISGITLARRKYPISADCVKTGKPFKFTVESTGLAV